MIKSNHRSSVSSSYHVVVVLGMAAAVGVSLLLDRGVVAEVADKKCGPFLGWEVECSLSVAFGEAFELDCTGSMVNTEPTNLLSFEPKVCESPAPWTSTTEKCLLSNTKVLTSLPGITMVTGTATGWTISSGLTGLEDVRISGSCSQGELVSGYFNVTLQTSSTTTTTASPEDDSSTEAQTESQNGGAVSTAASGLFASTAAAVTGLVALGLWA